MNKDVLVLNRNLIPNSVITWKKCMSLLYQGKCVVVDEDYIHYDFDLWKEFSNDESVKDRFAIATTHYRIVLPDIIALTKFDRLPRSQVKYSRQSIFQRDKYRCAYCGNKFPSKKLTIDHINPKSRGGIKSWSNSISACVPCNSHKAARTPDEANMPLKFEPSEPSWYQQVLGIADRPDLKPRWAQFLDSFIVKKPVENT